MYLGGGKKHSAESHPPLAMQIIVRRDSAADDASYLACTPDKERVCNLLDTPVRRGCITTATAALGAIKVPPEVDAYYFLHAVSSCDFSTHKHHCSQLFSVTVKSHERHRCL